MLVTLIAKTEMVDIPLSVHHTNFDEYYSGDSGADADELAHFAGRSCYQAWDMPNPATANDMGYLANILKQQHYSVLEHGSATFYIEGVSRNLTHELIRHRHLSYSELSQRYVDMKEAQFILPPAMFKVEFPEMWSAPDIAEDLKTEYASIVHDLEQLGIKGKKAREAARTILPGGMETKIVVTGNHRAWRDMLHKRYSVHADAEIRELACELLRQLKLLAPATYQDFPDEPFN